MMKLTLKDIQKITLGAERVEETDGVIRFYRFTKEQEELYKEYNPDFSYQISATAGIRLSFVTDSRTLSLKGDLFRASARGYYSMEIFADKERIGCINNFHGQDMTGIYYTYSGPELDFNEKYDLGEGKKVIDIYLPWSAGIALEEIAVDDDAFIESVKRDKKLLAFGDSITQGYDALYPSKRYASLLAEAMGAEEYNKAIGGDVFFPKLAKSKETFVPDYITAAYGTNDWNKLTKEEFEKNCKEFYESLSKNYPSSKIFAISPIWRKEENEEKPVGKFSFVENYIKETVASLYNVTFISGYDLVPHDESYFADLVLHPNDKGFGKQAESLYQKIERYL